MITQYTSIDPKAGHKFQPKVSIIVPTYNRGNYIQEMIESVISQTYNNWELIIVDDGSTDKTEKIVKQYISTNIAFYPLKHSNRSHARNFGLSKSTGEFISYLDSDDLFLPRKLEKQVKWLLDHPEIAMVYTSALQIDDVGDYYPAMYLAQYGGNIYKEVAMYIPVTITLPSVMIRKEIQDIIGDFDEELDRFEDTDMWRRVSREYKIGAMLEPLIKVRTHQGNRLQMLDPEKIFLEVQKYVNKVKMDDGGRYGEFVARGSSRLYYHYAVAFSKFPDWKEWTSRLYLASFNSHPVYFSYLKLKKYIQSLIKIIQYF